MTCYEHPIAILSSVPGLIQEPKRLVLSPKALNHNLLEPWKVTNL